MIKNCVQPCIGIFSIVGRILIFFCFWWAYDGVAEAFGDKRYGFQNEFYAWESPPIQSIEQLFSNPICPTGSRELYYFYWSGRNSFDTGDQSYDSISGRTFKYWIYESIPSKKFLLCAKYFLYNETYAQFGRSNLTCEQRKMRSCSQGRFCVPVSYQSCPITNAYFDSNGLLKTEIDPTYMPIAYFKIDTNFVSNYNNRQQNIYPGQPQDSYLVKTLTPVDAEYKDDSFIPVNTVNDLLFYSINSAQSYDRTISASYNKTLFFKRYTEWPKDALGKMFDEAFNIFDSLDEIIFLSDSGTITALVYLILICYVMPAIPFIFRFIGALKIDNIICWDLVLRIILLFMMLAQSLYIIKQCLDVRQYSEALLLNKSAVNFDQNQYDKVIEMIDGQQPYHYISISVSLIFLGCELLLWILLCLRQCCQGIKKFFQQLRFRQQIRKVYETENDKENLNKKEINQIGEIQLEDYEQQKQDKNKEDRIN